MKKEEIFHQWKAQKHREQHHLPPPIPLLLSPLYPSLQNPNPNPIHHLQGSISSSARRSKSSIASGRSPIARRRNPQSRHLCPWRPRDRGRGVAADMEGDAKARLLAWQNPSSRICRVSRASGGKDRHSKVLTSKGLRDRRVRLSVSTAIQFYDLQDRLGYDQPSKAVDWLIKAASAAIAELPTLDGAFADLSRKLEAAAAEGKQNRETDDRLASRSRSACSSDSGNSKGSVLSLSRRDKAKERHASSDDRNDDSMSSFGYLLAGGDTAGLLNKQMRNVQPTTTTATTTDYLTQGGLFGQPLKASPHAGFPIQAHFPPGAATGILPFNIAAVSGGDNAEIQPQFAFVQDHIIPVAQVAASGDYGLNFSISPGLAGLNRGTLQSNLQVPTSQLHHIQRFSSQVEGPNVPFFFGAAPAASSAPTENHFTAGLDARLQLYHGGVYCSSDLKAKETN